MELTKDQSILKAVVEEMLRRNPSQRRESSDIKVGLEVMNVIMPPGPIYVIADSPRIAYDFGRVFGHMTGRSCRHLCQPERCFGIEGSVVRLYTGRRTQEQQRIVEEIIALLQTRPNITMWHVGEWA